LVITASSVNIVPMDSHFLKQTDEALFPKILWNRPANRRQAGRILVVGGHTGHFSGLQASFAAAEASGIGECRLAVPTSLRAALASFAIAEFMPATPSGSLATLAVGPVLEFAREFDAILIGPDLGQNSETTILLESILLKSEIPVIIVADALTSLKHNPRSYIDRPQTLVVATLPELFRIAGALAIPLTVRTDTGLMGRTDLITSVTKDWAADWLIYGFEIIAGQGAEHSITPLELDFSHYSALTAAVAGTFWLQQRQDKFAALTSAGFILRQAALKAKELSDTITSAHLSGAIRRTISEHEGW
jgi:hypothetical protein